VRGQAVRYLDERKLHVSKARSIDHLVGSVRYWIKFVHTAKYKIKPHAIAINTNHIVIFPQLLTCP
jgi:hypothetical protein